MKFSLLAEVEALLHKSQTEAGESFGDIDIPQELQRRQERLEKIAQVKGEIEARAQARYEREKAEYETKLRERATKEKARGRKLGGKQPKAPEAGPKAKDQVNFTDGDSRIMPISGGGFEQAYNAQASVDMDTMLIVGNHVSQNPNDKQEVEPALAELKQLPENLGQVERAALDSGFFSEHNAQQLEENKIEPYIACGRQSHNLTLEERLAPAPAPPENSDAITAMKHRLKTEVGKEFYAQRKSTVEPVFGIIKEVMGFRRFMLRGINAVTGEWTLVCIAFKSEASLHPQCVNNRKSASKIRSEALAQRQAKPDHAVPRFARSQWHWKSPKPILKYWFGGLPVLFNVKEFLSPTDS